MQEIHHKFGVTEKANYEIQLFVDELIEKDRDEQLILHSVSNRFFKYCDSYEQKTEHRVIHACLTCDGHL